MTGQATGALSSNLKGLLEALGSTIGHALEFDSSGQCALSAPNDIELVIAAAGSEMLSVRGPVIRAEEAGLLRQALAINYNGLPFGMMLAFDDLSRQIMLVALRPVNTTTAETFLALLSEILDLVPSLRTQLVRLDDGAPTQRHHAPGSLEKLMIRG